MVSSTVAMGDSVFFFQAEDGIRDIGVTGVQTCALPISPPSAAWLPKPDILSDANGISFHRFQMASKTVVLVIMFLVSVWNDLGMPDINATLLGLMGISSGTYVGFSSRRQRTSPLRSGNSRVFASTGSCSGAEARYFAGRKGGSQWPI